MDFGGASTQITFETKDTIEDPRNKVMLKLYGQAYKVYTHSFLCYGRDQVLKRLLAKVLKVPACVWQGCHLPLPQRCLLTLVFTPGCPPALHTFPSQLSDFTPNPLLRSQGFLPSSP